jgi:hypothetical protein
MKIMCGKKKIGHDTTVYVDADARMIHLNLTEYEAPYKIVFDPKESGPDFEEFVKCLSRLNLPEHKMKALIKRGIPRKVWKNKPPIQKKETTKATADVDKIIANMTKLRAELLHKSTPVKDDPTPVKDDPTPVKDVAEMEKKMVAYYDSCMQKEDAAHVESVSEMLYRSVGM